MAQVNASANIYAWISGAWVLLGDSQPWSTWWGIGNNGPLDFLADVGNLKFRLNNSGGLYTPGGPNALAGFQKGIPVKLVVTFEGEEYVRFRGYISNIDPRPSNRDKTASVTALDWMDYAARHPIVNPGVLGSTYADELVDILLAEIEIKPQQSSLAPGVYAFPSVLDTVRSKTTAYSEFGKITLSDITHLYLRKDKTGGETLVLENADTRHGWVEPEQIPLAAVESGFLLKEDGDQLLLESGDGILLNEKATVTTFDSSIITNYDAPNGDAIINRVVAQAYPRRLDTSVQTLFQLDEPIEIAPGKTYTLEGNWVDPAGGFSISAQDWVTPVAVTDYAAEAVGDVPDPDLTDELQIVTWKPGTDGFRVLFQNNSDYLMNVTAFNPRAIGIYEYNPIQQTTADGASIREFEAQTLNFHQRYRSGTRTSRVYAWTIVTEYPQPRTVLKEISFCANASPALMMAFLHTDVGHVRQIDIDELGIDSNYYIQSVEADYRGGLIWVTWGVKEAPSVQAGMTPLAFEFSGGTTGDAFDFGPLPRVSIGTKQRTFAAWVKPNRVDGTRAIIAPHADTGGMLMFLSKTGSNGELRLYSNRYNVSPGQWRSDTTVINTGVWSHVAVCYDHTSLANVPIMYINGIPQAIVTVNSPAGTLNSENGTHVVIGNVKTATINYTWGFDGQIFDARIYNRLISAAEAVTLYNSGTPDMSLVTDGLVFQAFAVRTENAADYVDQELTEGTKIFENMYRQVGLAHGSPTGRAAPT